MEPFSRLQLVSGCSAVYTEANRGTDPLPLQVTSQGSAGVSCSVPHVPVPTWGGLLVRRKSVLQAWAPLPAWPVTAVMWIHRCGFIQKEFAQWNRDLCIFLQFFQPFLLTLYHSLTGRKVLILAGLGWKLWAGSASAPPHVVCHKLPVPLLCFKRNS